MNPPKRFLNVGGNNKGIPLALEYRGWEHVMLDIDPRSNADLICDARQLATLAPSAFDSVYCSQNLEHYHRHEGLQVLKGFRHILKNDGFALWLDLGAARAAAPARLTRARPRRRVRCFRACPTGAALRRCRSRELFT